MTRSPYYIPLTLRQDSVSALRVVLSDEISRVEQWIRVHRRSAAKVALQNSERFLDQLQVLRSEVETGIAQHTASTVARRVARLQQRAER